MKVNQFKEYYIEDNSNPFYAFVGKATDIKALYRTLTKNINSPIMGRYCNFPKFNEHKIYGVLIDIDNASDTYNRASIVSADYIMSMILSGDAYDIVTGDGIRPFFTAETVTIVDDDETVTIEEDEEVTIEDEEELIPIEIEEEGSWWDQYGEYHC